MLPFGDVVISRFAGVHVAREGMGVPTDSIHAQIVAVCIVPRAICFTRIVKRLLHIGVELVDP